jgi:SAM-dependent methyltransferase
MTCANGRKIVLVDRLAYLKAIGLQNSLKLVWRCIRRQRAKSYSQCRELFAGKRGLEIGGPSALLERNNAIPVYPELAELDNCLFAANTVWSSKTRQGRHFHYDTGRRVGYQYICDGTDLREIPAGRYDCVLSCNNLEHIANPLKALKEWMRVLIDGGAMLVVTPARDYTVDHRRPVTSLEHLQQDWERGISEDNLSHLEEILALHDLSRDPAAGGREAFRRRCEQNGANRCMHHHVFDAALLASVLDLVGLRICAIDAVLPFHLIVIARKPRTGEPYRPFSDFVADFRRHSPFPSDHVPSPHAAN